VDRCWRWPGSAWCCCSSKPFETDLRLLSRIGRSTAIVPLGSLLLPLAGGIAVGFVMPEVFVSGECGRTIVALFMGVALTVSSLPVVAKILIELGLMRRNVGQFAIVAGMADDIVGWIMQSILAGAVGPSSCGPAS
jgi:Kef-type K+ transport system membrane component KefB